MIVIKGRAQIYHNLQYLKILHSYQVQEYQSQTTTIAETANSSNRLVSRLEH